MLAPVIEKRSITPDLFVLGIEAPFISSTVKPGQFVNILPKVGAVDPLLRRAFSVYNVSGNCIEVILQIHGRGTKELSTYKKDDLIDLIGPLGRPWNYQDPEHKTSILVAGGVGVASMPSLLKELRSSHKHYEVYYGARTSDLFADEYLDRVHYSTDDGSKGHHGTVIHQLRDDLRANRYERPKLFVCGPTPMMRAAADLATEFGIPCEISLETEMACGIGICQGCPVQTTEQEFTTTGRKFHLVCTHGPSFDKEQIVF